MHIIVSSDHWLSLLSIFKTPSAHCKLNVPTEDGCCLAYKNLLATQFKGTKEGLLQNKKRYNHVNRILCSRVLLRLRFVLTNDWLTAHFFFKANAIWRWQHEHFGPFSKTFKTNLGFKFLHMELTYKLFMCLFSPDVLGVLMSKKHTKQSAVYLISPGRSAQKSHQAVSVARSGRLRSLLSHRWAANYMRRKCSE